ncbi:hypothetical protein B0T10DRAFT_567510 [Thelonectria olida]|uniref:FMN-dependent dehydrogenase domain-containing protein n=1 Tax=Thelonectria olida TaxID=1576542 RepID=A0A9P9AJA2_9HYPO|nr:hypothetical protein B0T10DRAFT_567510 [Thelonectria olida]
MKSITRGHRCYGKQPVGVQSAYHPDKETGLASACAELRVPFIISTAIISTAIISTASTSTIEEIAAAAASQAPRWIQLYWPRAPGKGSDTASEDLERTHSTQWNRLNDATLALKFGMGGIVVSNHGGRP